MIFTKYPSFPYRAAPRKTAARQSGLRPLFSPVRTRSPCPFFRLRKRAPLPLFLLHERAPLPLLPPSSARVCESATAAVQKTPRGRQTKRHKKRPREAKGRPRLGAPRACSRYLSFRFTYSVCKISCARCEPGAPKKFLYSCITAGFSWLLRMPAFLSSSYSALARLERRSTCLRV